MAMYWTCDQHPDYRTETDVRMFQVRVRMYGRNIRTEHPDEWCLGTPKGFPTQVVRMFVGCSLIRNQTCPSGCYTDVH